MAIAKIYLDKAARYDRMANLTDEVNAPFWRARADECRSMASAVLRMSK